MSDLDQSKAILMQYQAERGVLDNRHEAPTDVPKALKPQQLTLDISVTRSLHHNEKILMEYGTPRMRGFRRKFTNSQRL